MSEPTSSESRRFHRIKELFRVDLRSLALFRFCLGLLLLIDLGIRVGDVSAFYSDDGILSRAALTADPGKSSWCFSLHMLGGSALFQGSLFLIAAVSSCCFLLGYRTRLATAITLIFICSMHHRNPLLQQGCDSFMRVLLFWSLFLPVGAKWSIDALRRRRNDRLPLPLEIRSASSSSILSAGSAAILLQVYFVYLFTVLLKTDPVWWKEGTAIFYALNLDRFTTPFGQWLLEQTSVHKPMSLATYYFELFGPILAFVPWKNQLFRAIAVFLFIGFHLVALDLALELGLFSWIFAAAWLVFLPTAFWERWLPEVIHRLSPAHRLRAFLKNADLKGRLFKEPWNGISLRTIQTFVVGFFLLYILLGNIRTTDHDKFVRIFPEEINWIGELSGTKQKWSMFSAAPPSSDSWEVISGKLSNGMEIDLLTHRPITWEKPDLVSASYKNAKWRKYMGNLAKSRNAPHREEFLNWLTRNWNQSHPPEEHVSAIKYFLVEEKAIVGIPSPWSIRQIWPPEDVPESVAKR